MPPLKILSPTDRDLQIANLSALAITLSLLDASIPSPIPGMKPGFANIVVLLTLYRLGWQAALWVGLLRVFASALMLGTLLTPGFWLSLSGALASLASLYLARHLPSRYFTAISHSLIAAQAHLLAQLALVRLVFIPDAIILTVFLPLAATALLTGLANGLIVNRLSRT